MATLAQVDAAIATAIEAFGTSPTRMLSDSLANLEGLAAGSAKYQLRVDHETQLDSASSSAAWDVATVTVTIFHELADSTDERAYTKAAMLTDQKSLTQPSWWEAISGIREVKLGPTIQEEATRQGNTVKYSYAVSIVIDQ
jgi:hypothetical protein